MQIPPKHSSSHMGKTLQLSCYSTYLIMFCISLRLYTSFSEPFPENIDLLSLDSMTSCETNCITLVRKLYLWNYVAFVVQARDGKLDKTNSCSTITSSVHVPMSSTKPESSHGRQRVPLCLDKLHWAVISKICCDHVAERTVCQGVQNSVLSPYFTIPTTGFIPEAASYSWISTTAGSIVLSGISAVGCWRWGELPVSCLCTSTAWRSETAYLYTARSILNILRITVKGMFWIHAVKTDVWTGMPCLDMNLSWLCQTCPMYDRCRGHRVHRVPI